MPEPDMTPATRHDLQLLRAEIREDFDRFAAKLERFEAKLAELVGMFTSFREYLGDLVRPFDDKYKHLPGEVTAVKQELVAHAGDKSIHHTHARTRRAQPKRRP